MNYSGGRVVMDGSNVVFHENPSRCGRIADHLWNMSKRRNFFPFSSAFTVSLATCELRNIAGIKIFWTGRFTQRLFGERSEANGKKSNFISSF